MAIRSVPRCLLLPGVCLIALWIGVCGAHAAASCSACPGDFNNDGEVGIDELVLAVNFALNGCPTPGPTQSSGLLSTGQTQCDDGSGTLGTCPGSPRGQDGEITAGAPPTYTDNGDGTISDSVTGLTWEKLSSDGSIHRVNNTYTWANAFSAKIAALNTAPCFADHCDWRLPNRRELESLVDLGRVTPAVDPAFNTACKPGCTVMTCSCTQPDMPYWSSTSYQDPTAPPVAWAVDENVGIVNAFDKTNPNHVRAVRGGL
jgi:hypothetical protein